MIIIQRGDVVDILQEAEAMVSELRTIVQADMAKAQQEYLDSKKPNTERLRALGLLN